MLNGSTLREDVYKVQRRITGSRGMSKAVDKILHENLEGFCSMQKRGKLYDVFVCG